MVAAGPPRAFLLVWEYCGRSNGLENAVGFWSVCPCSAGRGAAFPGYRADPLQ